MNLKIDTVEDILETAHLYKITEVMKIAIKLKLFRLLEYKSLNLDNLSTELQCDKYALELVLNLLVNMNLLTLENERYSISKVALKYLTDHWGFDMSDLFLYNSSSAFTADNVLNNFFSKVENKQNDDLDNYMKAMHIGSRYAALVIARNIKGENKKILDLGCGSGILSLCICKINKSAKAYLVDYENVLKLTKKNIEKNNLSNRIICIPSDIFNFESIEVYDYIVISNVFHFYDSQKIESLLKKYYKYLNCDGRIFIYDTFINKSNEYSLLYSLEWLSEGICFMGVDRLADTMSKIGYKNIVFKSTDDSARNLLIAGR